MQQEIISIGIHVNYVILFNISYNFFFYLNYFICNFSLICHNVIPIVIFDGSYEDGKKKTTWKRTREQLHSALRHNPTHDSIDSILPIFSKGNFLVNCFFLVKKRKFRNGFFINKRFALNEMFQRNASKFAIFYV